MRSSPSAGIAPMPLNVMSRNGAPAQTTSTLIEPSRPGRVLGEVAVEDPLGDLDRRHQGMQGERLHGLAASR